MNEFRADLHCHSTYSDGTYTPSELIELACKIGLSGLSITDHDTIEAYREAIPEAAERQLPLIPGLELSTVHKGKSVHVLAYSFQLNSADILDFCKNQRARRENRNKAILERLASHGMPIEEDELSSPLDNRSFGRPHIAQAMVKRGYVSSIQQAFHEYIGDGKLCFYPGSRFSVEETIEIIHKARGVAIIAHPHLIENSIVKDLLEMKFDGIEGYYARFSSEDHARWIKTGMKRGWLITGGSDFHGAIKPNIPLGSSWVGEEVFKTLHNKYLENN